MGMITRGHTTRLPPQNRIMTKRTKSARPLWEDRFATPSGDDLFAAVDQTVAPHLTLLRDALRGLDCGERITWCGLPWRWTLAYRAPDRPSEPDPLAYLVPNPAGPILVLRITHAEFTELPHKKLSRFVRDGLGQARLVAGVTWPEWKVQTQSNAEDLIGLFRSLRERALAGA